MDNRPYGEDGFTGDNVWPDPLEDEKQHEQHMRDLRLYGYLNSMPVINPNQVFVADASVPDEPIEWPDVIGER